MPNYEYQNTEVIIPKFIGFDYVGYQYTQPGDYVLEYFSDGQPKLTKYTWHQKSMQKNFIYKDVTKPVENIKVIIENAPGYAIEDILEMKPSIVLFTNEKVRHGMFSLGYYYQEEGCYYWGKYKVPVDTYLKGYIVKK
jgi:hypothetical protein